ncbi:hypothetical protein C8R43DRAFT_951534 [Mycena crocata]|nr:hypothetical protein C8R43DRAFT_951534 [Mycena crocata]
MSSHRANPSPPGARQWGRSSDLAQRIIASRLETYEKYISERGSTKGVPRLVDLLIEALSRFPDECMDACLAHLSPIILGSRVWEWTHIPILANEQYIRDNDSLPGLVKLSQAEIIFPVSFSTRGGLTITRPKSLPRFEIMCAARQPRITIQPSTAVFSLAFERISNGLLRNLDWKNILVAGGIILGTLISITDIPKLWASSDIDMYIYGLSATQATDKINDVYEIFRSNLPTGTPTLAVKNSKTITFYAEHSFRRIQLVLKLVKSPTDVLLNFDLDICAMGWNGTDVLMLPRAARALETGCNIFTMSLVNGHYLSERRESQPTRVFKYTSRGYGLRILPSYAASLEVYPGANMLVLDIPFLSRAANAHARKIFQDAQNPEGKPRLRYSDLDTRNPRPSCLSKFSLLMSHATYWEMARHKDAIIDDQPSAFVSYEDEVDPWVDFIPRYHWNAHFDRTSFEHYIQRINHVEVENWIRSDLTGRLWFHGVKHGDELDVAQRVTFSHSMAMLLESQKNIKTPVLLPCTFAVYANNIVSRLQKEPMLTPAVPGYDFTLHGDEEEGLFMWTIGPELMWQQQDRRIDECASNLTSMLTVNLFLRLFEVLLAFQRINVPIAEERQAGRFRTEVVRFRRAQSSTEDELGAFARWIGEVVPA